METSHVKARIKGIISSVSGIPVEDITDNASYSDDLGLDSLTLLEIGVDMDYEFKLGVPEERLQHIRSVQDAFDVVMETLAPRKSSLAA